MSGRNLQGVILQRHSDAQTVIVLGRQQVVNNGKSRAVMSENFDLVPFHASRKPCLGGGIGFPIGLPVKQVVDPTDVHQLIKGKAWLIAQLLQQT